LWETFGGTINEKGYKVLNERVGLIYGDSITLERAEAILSRLAAQGFASSNIVFGIGSFTYQYITRDSFGMAVKATNATINGVDSELFKDPITDNGTKRSAKGLLRVEKINGEYVLFDQQTREQERMGELKTIFLDGKLLVDETLEGIRQRVSESL
jgi:nicotinamide phosphoribosyltransferase